MLYAKCKDPAFIRIGTSGGLGLKPGTVVVSNKVRPPESIFVVVLLSVLLALSISSFQVYNSYAEEFVRVPVLGKEVKRPAQVTQAVVEQLLGVFDLTLNIFGCFV